ncbi:hypothetical protein FNV43_RR07404 [Rhamnella rubrinervis]|uniref:Uncharacterized protein n=1 Tax=Rhamnella rubrinervis TaxID=2594499 RepID=A0A8K0MMD4_9ROSA|nr:hypothetical protein FNV43_RR07404 [Rhamnella rubrinervis]
MVAHTAGDLRWPPPHASASHHSLADAGSCLHPVPPQPDLKAPNCDSSSDMVGEGCGILRGIGALILVALSGGCGWRYVKEQGKHVVAQQRAVILLINFVRSPTNDLVVFGGGHAATITLRAAKQGLLKAKAIAVVAPTWLVLFLLSLVKNLAWKQGMQNIHAFVVMIIVWNFPDQVAYADLVVAGSLAAAREKGLVSPKLSSRVWRGADLKAQYGSISTTLANLFRKHDNIPRRKEGIYMITIVYNNLCFDVNLDAENELVSWCCGSSYNVNARGNPLRSRLGLFLKREKVEAILFGDDHVGCCRKKAYIGQGTAKQRWLQLTLQLETLDSRRVNR